MTGWSSAIRRAAPAGKAVSGSNRPPFEPAQVDWKRLVTIDFETYYDQDYTLRKLTTSQYVRDARFEVLMMGIKIGERPARVVRGDTVAHELARIDWHTHSLLCHHTQFDGLILSQHYGVIPKFYYDTLSMARGWLSNDIGAGLDEVDRYYGGSGKVEGGEALVSMRGIHLANMHPEVYRKGAEYCQGDVDKCYALFRERLLPQFPQSELDLIDATVQMFTCPVLRLDEPRARAAMDKEIAEREALLLSVSPADFSVDSMPAAWRRELARAAPEYTEREARLFAARKMIGSSERFAELLRAEGVEPPVKVSPAWLKQPPAERAPEGKYTYAFARDDLPMQELLAEHPSARVRTLCETRLAVKSNINITRAGRLLESGAGGRPMPVYYKFYGAHTGRFSGGDGQNWQNFTRGGELRLSILAPRGHVLAVADSGQIEARVNAWLWGQQDLLESFRKGEDIYSLFASENIYRRPITKADKEERHVGKTAILGLGYQMGAAKFRDTLARGVGGPAVFIDEMMARSIVNAYRRRMHRIAHGWTVCEQIIDDMLAGRQGQYGPLCWERETLWLPNAMRLRYPNLRRDSEGNTVYERKGQPVKLYGGLLCENLVQALARIIVAADQLLKISARYPVVMTTHDEVVACVPAREGQRAYRAMHQAMTEPPAWCADLPLAAEGGWAVNYSK